MVFLRGISLLRFWVGLVGGLNALGWVLSAFGQLGTVGYAISLAPMIYCALWAARLPTLSPALLANRPLFTWGRFRRPLPAVFFLLAIGALVGGLLYEPNHGDGLAYRTPRVLNWLSEGRWHWINTSDQRLNTQTLAYEWVTAPALALSASDRLLPLISFVSYLFLPGLCFSVLRGMGVRVRVAWGWMWLLPTAFGFVLQSGGILTDLFGSVLALAAFQFAFQARRDQTPSTAKFSLLAIALTVGTKTSNLPLLLPWALAIWPLIPLLRQKPKSWVATGLLAIICSNAPIVVLNLAQGADWTGKAAEARARPVIGNGSPTLDLLLPSEDCAGLGWPLMLAVVAFLGGAVWDRCRRQLSQKTPPKPWGQHALIWSPWVSLLVPVAQSGILSASRILLPYYPLLLGGVLSGESTVRWMRTAWWRWGTVAAGLSSAVVMITSPMRPLWPAQTILASVGEQDGVPMQPLRNVYTVYRERAHGFDRLLSKVPANVDRIGMLSQFQFLEGPLWRPYGQHRVIRPAGDSSPENFRRLQVEYVVLRVADVPRLWPAGLVDWLARGRAEVLAKDATPQFVLEPDPGWILVRLGNGK